MAKHLDKGSLAVIAVTFVLFATALLTKGFAHGLLLEAGVFLVSVKLIMMAYRNSVTSREIMMELRDIKGILRENEG